MTEKTILERANIKVTPTSLVVADPSTSYEDFEELFAFLGEAEQAFAWWVGDAFLACEGIYPVKVYQAAELTGLAESTIENRASICSRFPRSRRRGNVKFSLHAELAYNFTPGEQKEWLDKVVRNGWTRSMLREQLAPIREQQKLAKNKGILVPGKNGPVEVLPPEVVIESHICHCLKCGRAHRDDLDVEE